MKERRAFTKTAEWLGHEKEENSTAVWTQHASVVTGGTKFFKDPGAFAISEPVDIIEGSTTFDVVGRSTTFRLNTDVGDDIIFVNGFNTLIVDEPYGSTAKVTSPELELYRAITNASEDQRLTCMRVLGLISDDDYVDPGPDPQPVDDDWLASIRGSRRP